MVSKIFSNLIWLNWKKQTDKTATAARGYYGAHLGRLSELDHGVSGDVYAVDSRTLFIKNFNYDGQGPGNCLFIYLFISFSVQIPKLNVVFLFCGTHTHTMFHIMRNRGNTDDVTPPAHICILNLIQFNLILLQKQDQAKWRCKWSNQPFGFEEKQ